MNTSGFPQNPYMGVPPQVPPTAAVPYGPSAQKPNTIYIVFTGCALLCMQHILVSGFL